MADFSDIRLDKSASPPGGVEPPRGDARVTVVVLIVVALAAAAGYLIWSHRSPAVPPATNAAAAPQRHDRQLPVERAADIDVPPLDESDALVRQLVSQLSKHPTVLAWLTTDHLIRNFAVVIQNIGDRESPAKHLTTVKPAGAFAVVRDGSGTYIDPASYRRYDGYADALAGIDARGAARLYLTLKPRIGEAFRDLGDPGGDADAHLKRAILELLATPAIDARVPLTQQSVMYKFADPALESLSAPQRQLLRMGPRNIRIVQQKLREIAPYAGIDLGGDGRR